MPKGVLLVAIVVVRTCHTMTVVIVMGMICIPTLWMILDLGFLAKAMSNRAPNLYLSGLLLLY